MGEVANKMGDILTIESVRESLIRQEDTIVFTLIERSKFPMNFPAYNSGIPGFSGSLVDYVVQQTEAIQSKVPFPLFFCIGVDSVRFMLLNRTEPNGKYLIRLKLKPFPIRLLNGNDTSVTENSV